MNFHEGVRETFVQLARLVLYPVSFLARFFARSLLLICTAAPIALPLLALVVLYLSLSDQKVLPSVIDLTEYTEFINSINIAPFSRAVAFLIGAGVFAGILKMMSRFAWTETRELWTAVWGVLREGWLPNWKIKKAFAVTWRGNFAKIRSKTQQTLKSAWRLTATLIAGIVLAVVAYPLFTPPVQLVDRYVAIVDTRDIKTETTSRNIKLFMRSGAVFSLAHVEDAQPRNGEGICLGVPQQEWLKEFRKAIENCIKEEPTDDGSKPVFEVTAYASIAPMRVGDDTSKSERLNCKVANWRAAAVGAYLINPNEEGPGTRWRCEDVKNAFNQTEPKNDSQCGEHYEVPKNQEGNPFRVEVHQWSTPDEMVNRKPVDDGERPSPRRYDVEIMNRVVHIEVPDDFCAAVAQEASAP